MNRRAVIHVIWGTNDIIADTSGSEIKTYVAYDPDMNEALIVSLSEVTAVQYALSRGYTVEDISDVYEHHHSEDDCRYGRWERRQQA